MKRWASFAIIAVLAFCGTVLMPATAMAFISTGDGGWTWVSPQPAGNGDNYVTFVDQSRGWIVGGNGTILHTFNGGSTWYRESSPTKADLNAVTFIDPADGWAVGEAGAIVRTTDGGDTWTTQTSGTDNNLLRVSFLDADHGWAVGEGPTVLWTSDGGQTWTTSTPAPATPFYYCRGVAFADPLDGWAVGDQATVLHSTDGGLSWASQNVGIPQPVDGPPQTVFDVSCIDAQHAFIATGAGIYLTSDGGDTWSTPASCPADGYLFVRFINSSEGWAIGMSGGVIHTVDGGQTWLSQGSLPSVGASGVSFVDSLHGWAVNGDGTIVATSDGGTSWSEQSSGSWMGFDTPIYFLDLAVLDKQTICAVGSVISRSTDGGLRWTQQSLGALGVGYLHSVSFADGQHGVAASDSGQALVTGDGGTTWQAFPTGVSWPQGVALAPGTKIGWIVGFAGGLRKTTDDGKTWRAQDSGTTAYLFGVDCLNANDAWAVGDAGTILHTTDGGAQWTKQPSGTTYQLFAADFLDAQNGWVVGGQDMGNTPVILHTTDGGSHWTTQATDATTRLRDVSFVNDQDGWAVGEFGVVVRTTDGGQTWTTQDPGTKNHFGGVVATDAQSAWAVGDAGMILHTSDGGLPLPDDLPPITELVGTTGSSWSNVPYRELVASDPAPQAPGALRVQGTGTSAGASGVQLTMWVVDPTGVAPSGWAWHAGTRVALKHQGVNTISYRSVDNAGNVEAVAGTTVNLDTRRPTPNASRATVRHGHSGILHYSIEDPRPGSPTAAVVIKVKTSAGKIVMVRGAGHQKVDVALTFRFHCSLRRGLYRFCVYATDAAGNQQTKVAINTLVVR
jgi:photosystem II stability/assembly factor-like uncharacterized protein